LSQASFSLPGWKGKMRACFLGQNICGLGFGIATLHTPPLVMDHPAPESVESGAVLTIGQHVSTLPKDGLQVFSDTQAVTNSPRLMA
jgi:hypothetical protein